MRRPWRILLIVCGASAVVLFAAALLGSVLASRAYSEIPEALDVVENATSGQVQAEQVPLESGLLSSTGATRLTQGDAEIVARHVIHHGPIPWRRLDRAPVRAVVETTFELPDDTEAPGTADPGSQAQVGAGEGGTAPTPHVRTVLPLSGGMRMDLGTPRLTFGGDTAEEGQALLPEVSAGPVTGFIEIGPDGDAYEADVSVADFRTLFLIAPLAGTAARIELDYTLVGGAPVGTARYSVEGLALGGRDVDDPASPLALRSGEWSVSSEIVDPPAPAPEERRVYVNTNVISFDALRSAGRAYSDGTLRMTLEIDDALRRELNGREGQVLGIEPSVPGDPELEALRGRLIESAPVLDIEKLAVRTDEGTVDLSLRATTAPAGAPAPGPAGLLAAVEAKGEVTISRQLLRTVAVLALASLPEEVVPETALEPARLDPKLDAWLATWEERGYVKPGEGDLVTATIAVDDGVLQLNGTPVPPSDLLPALDAPEAGQAEPSPESESPEAESTQ